jgi:Mrp family chromosome partitioning ATPase
MLGSSRRALFVLGLVLFGVSTLEALLFPATYRASAYVAVVSPAPSLGSLEPVRLSRRLEEVTLDAGLLGELLQELGADGESARAAWILRRAVRIASIDGRTFEVSVTDSNQKRAQALCDHVARKVVSRAPQLGRDGSTTGPVTASILAASTRPSWPTTGQSILLVLGAIGAAAVWGFAMISRGFAARVPEAEPAYDTSDGAAAPLGAGAAVSLSGAAAPPPPGFVSPAMTLGLGTAVAPPIAAAPPAPTGGPQTERAFAAVASIERTEVAPRAARTDPMLPPPTPHAVAASTTSPEFVPAPTGVQPGPLPLRRSTLILGSPIAPAMPTPLPAKPTPTSIFRPSPLPPLPPGPAAVSQSSKPPPPSAAKSPSAHALDRSGARYSYVSTPVPAQYSPNVDLRDVSITPDPALHPATHLPWRRQLFSLGVAQCFVTAVCSVGEARKDKARFAVELALCLAETGHARVLLVEADLAEPEVRALLGLTLIEGESLADQLSVSMTEPRAWKVLRFKEKLHALVQDKPALPELILGEQFRDSIITLCAGYDFVVLNGPPAETGLAGRFTGWVDGAVIVASDEESSGVQKAKAALGLKQFLKIYTPGASVR